jgi:hypothetical protein
MNKNWRGFERKSFASKYDNITEMSLRDSENTTKNLVTIVGAPPRFEMITFQK